NMRLPARQRRSLTYEDAAAINPRLIYVSITGYGEDGPERDLPGTDIYVQARVGDVAGRRLPAGAMPGPTRLSHFDTATSMLGAYAIMLALWERERTGLGQRIETNLLLSALAMQMGQMTRLVGNVSEGRPIMDQFAVEIYECNDGRYIFTPIGGERWDRVCDAMGLAELAKDERFGTPEKRTQRAEELRKILATHFFTKPAVEWESILKAAGARVSILKDMTEVYADPQVVANQMIVEYEQPGIGALTMVNVPFKLSRTADEQRLRRPVPYKGEHTLEVLKELGYRDQEIQTFRNAEAIG
ncbi:MAG: CaiB/BaiF CoA-transferase family protein, partial [Chloroflexota bacterium]